jgi:nitric oxide reductase activation protein
MAKGLIINQFNKGISKNVFVPTGDEATLIDFATSFLEGKKVICEEIYSNNDKSTNNDRATVVLKNLESAKSMYLTFYVNNLNVDDKDIDNLLTGKKIDGLTRDDVRTTLYSVRN